MSAIQLSEGVTFEELEGPIYEAFNKAQKTFSTGFVRVQPYNQVMPRYFLQFEKRIKDFSARSHDVWVSSFPKCGTTWTQEMVWCIMNDLNFAQAKSKLLDERVPFFELSALTEDTSGIAMEDTLDKVENMESPRIIKTHFSWDMLPTDVHIKKAKVIYVTRNPRDTCVSFHHHMGTLEGYDGTLEEFTEAFLEGITGYYTPFLHHVLQYWKNRHLPNVCFITYEEMKADLPSVIRKVSTFLGKTVEEGDRMEQLVDHLSFKKMKDNAAVNKQDFVQLCKEAMGDKYSKAQDEAKFMRKGKAGDWKAKFSPELVQKFEAWEQKWLDGTDLKFTYEV